MTQELLIDNPTNQESEYRQASYSSCQVSYYSCSVLTSRSKSLPEQIAKLLLPSPNCFSNVLCSTEMGK